MEIALIALVILIFAFALVLIAVCLFVGVLEMILKTVAFALNVVYSILKLPYYTVRAIAREIRKRKKKPSMLAGGRYWCANSNHIYSIYRPKKDTDAK